MNAEKAMHLSIITVFSMLLHREMLMLQLAEMQIVHKSKFPPMSHQLCGGALTCCYNLPPIGSCAEP